MMFSSHPPCCFFSASSSIYVGSTAATVQGVQCLLVIGAITLHNKTGWGRVVGSCFAFLTLVGTFPFLCPVFSAVSCLLPVSTFHCLLSSFNLFAVLAKPRTSSTAMTPCSMQYSQIFSRRAHLCVLSVMLRVQIDRKCRVKLTYLYILSYKLNQELV